MHVLLCYALNLLGGTGRDSLVPSEGVSERSMRACQERAGGGEVSWSSWPRDWFGDWLWLKEWLSQGENQGELGPETSLFEGKVVIRELTLRIPTRILQALPRENTWDNSPCIPQQVWG